VIKFLWKIAARQGKNKVEFQLIDSGIEKVMRNIEVV
jgi:hypothetical protein